MYLEVKFRNGRDLRNYPVQTFDYVDGEIEVNQIAEGNIQNMKELSAI